MTASKNSASQMGKICRLAPGPIALGIAFGFLLITDADAQEPKELPPVQVLTPAPVQPLNIAPPQNLARPMTLEPPKALETPQSGGQQPSTATPALENPATGIQVDALSAVDPDSAGTMTIEGDGYGAEMWKGTDRPLAEWLISQLPAGTNSPAQRKMMERLLLSTAVPPVGEASRSLIGLRVEKLAEMGGLEGVSSLLKVTPGRHEDETLARIEADSLFLANNLAGACSLVSTKVETSEETYWQKGLYFCQALAGQHEKARMGAGLMREMGVDDPNFFQLLAALSSGEKPKLKSLASPKPLHLAMARAAKAILPTDASWSSDPGVLRTVAVNPSLSPEARIDAAEQAEGVGALSTETLRKIYSGVAFTKEDLSGSFSKADAERGPIGRAILYRSAESQKIPVAKAEVIQKALSLAQEGGRYPSSVRVYLPILKTLEPSADLLWFARDAIRAFLSAGEIDAAGSWFKIVRAGALFNEDVKAVQDALMPLVWLAGHREADLWGSEGIKEWWAGRQTSLPDRDKSVLLFALLDVFGATVDPQIWRDLLKGPQKTSGIVQSPPLWFALDAAAVDIRVAEVVAYSAIGLGSGGPAATEPMFLRHILSALVKVGRADEARALALEAAVSAGL